MRFARPGSELSTGNSIFVACASLFTPHMLCTFLLQITVRFALPDDEVTEEDVEQLRKDGASEAQVRRITLKLLVGPAGRAGSARYADAFGQAGQAWPRELAGVAVPVSSPPCLVLQCGSIHAEPRVMQHLLCQPSRPPVLCSAMPRTFTCADPAGARVAHWAQPG